jgi:hypothetical protein
MEVTAHLILKSEKESPVANRWASLWDWTRWSNHFTAFAENVGPLMYLLSYQSLKFKLSTFIRVGVCILLRVLSNHKITTIDQCVYLVLSSITSRHVSASACGHRQVFSVI